MPKSADDTANSTAEYKARINRAAEVAAAHLRDLLAQGATVQSAGVMPGGPDGIPQDVYPANYTASGSAGAPPASGSVGREGLPGLASLLPPRAPLEPIGKSQAVTWSSDPSSNPASRMVHAGAGLVSGAVSDLDARARAMAARHAREQAQMADLIRQHKARAAITATPLPPEGKMADLLNATVHMSQLEPDPVPDEQDVPGAPDEIDMGSGPGRR